MINTQNARFYPPLEEKINIGSHALGLALSMVATVFLVVHASLHGSARHVVSFSIFGASLIALYLASTVYHSARDPVRRNRLRIIDHATIYVLIAGTYTPFTLVTLSGPVGWSIFGVVWGLAVAGIILKIFFTGRFHLVSTLMYVLMGWIIIFAIKPLVSSLSSEGLFWLIGGGLAYTIGAVIYSIKKINFNHAAFHLFVVLGSFCHFISVYVYVLPAV